MIVQHTLFLPSSLGHGGNRRSAQITEMIRAISPDLLVLGYDTPDRKSSKKKIAITILRGLLEVIKYPIGFFLSPGIGTIMGLGHLPSQLRALARSQNAKELTIVWESTIPAMFGVIKKLSRRGVRIFAFPHNVEAFSLEPRNPRKMLRWLRYESRILGLCEEVVCISPLDAWLYANLGVKSTVLPYEISQEARTKFEVVVNARETSEKDTFLILGTSTNEPTRAGIFKLLEASANSDNPVRIAVVSRGLLASKLEVSQNVNVKIFPDLPDSSLEDELIRAKALIVLQEWGTGQLTRIQEAIEMGIPVYGNELAARGYSLTGFGIPEAVSTAFPGCNLIQILGNTSDLKERSQEVLLKIGLADFGTKQVEA